MNISRMNPAGGMKHLGKSLEGLWGRSRGKSLPYHETLEMPDWSLVVDISETDGEYMICGDIPGVRMEDVHLTVDQGMLTVEGNRRMRPEDVGRKFNRSECSSGRFSRSFRIPDDADARAISISYRDGMFILTLPRLRHAASGRLVDLYVE